MSPRLVAGRLTSVALVGGVAALALSGCGGRSGPALGAPPVMDTGVPASSGTPDACRLITTDEVARVLGEHSPDQATYTVTASTGRDGACTYAWTANGGGDEFTVNQFPASSYVAQPGVEPRQISGIGDQAFEEVGSYYARVGDQMVNVVNLQEGEGSDEDLLRVAANRLS
ncbi:hypothetical protein [Nocardioides panacisoli]|uniref:DUF3558 domain-containing protein n=1 Tax=Nocardioides panacisoli TaxID=627624 RepID=A0ABP7I3R3_9ACTN